MNLCEKVRKTCLEQYKTQHHIKIGDVRSLAHRIQMVEWDKEGWHLQSSDRERNALYILALDSINFCFWPTEGYEYEDLATTLTKMGDMLTPDYLQNVTVEEMEKAMRSHHDKGMVPPLMQERCRMWNQVGSVLNEKFNGSALKVIEQAKGSAVELVSIIVENFSGFRDFTDNVYFLKRAQILVGDWNASLDLKLNDLSQLTCFPDYRLPQLLREENVLLYDFILSSIIDSKQELQKGSEYELAIRASTVVAVESLVTALRKISPEQDWNALKVDWYLWQVGEQKQLKRQLRPHHRVRTTNY